MRLLVRAKHVTASWIHGIWRTSSHQIITIWAGAEPCALVLAHACCGAAQHAWISGNSSGCISARARVPAPGTIQRAGTRVRKIFPGTPEVSWDWRHATTRHLAGPVSWHARERAVLLRAQHGELRLCLDGKGKVSTPRTTLGAGNVFPLLNDVCCFFCMTFGFFLFADRMQRRYIFPCRIHLSFAGAKLPHLCLSTKPKP